VLRIIVLGIVLRIVVFRIPFRLSLRLGSHNNNSCLVSGASISF
jgi:hypothetical protein